MTIPFELFACIGFFTICSFLYSYYREDYRNEIKNNIQATVLFRLVNISGFLILFGYLLIGISFSNAVIFKSTWIAIIVAFLSLIEMINLLSTILKREQ